MNSKNGVIAELELPGTPKNPRAPLVHTARFMRYMLNTSGTGPPVMQMAAALEPAVQGGAWAEWLTIVNGIGVVNFNLRMPNLNHLLPDHPIGWFEAESATIEVHAGGNARLRLSPHVVLNTYLPFTSGEGALVDFSAAITLALGPSMVTPNWNVVVQAKGWYSASGTPKTQTHEYGCLTVECELPVTVGPAPALIVT